MDQTAGDGQEEPARALTSREQWRLTVAIVVIVLAVFWLLPLAWTRLFTPTPPPPPPHEDGSFAVTDRQWATLRFEPARIDSLASGTSSDGKIAVDDDLTTPVYSPFTGRVTRVFAKVGDKVRAGAPLFEVMAAEFVQAQSDLVAARNALSIANVQYRQARDAEARQHDLYEHKGASLKDWQQSQTDLANADAGVSNAKAGLKAVGNRLRILGADARIAESSHTGEAVVRAPVAGVVTQRLIGIGQNVGSVSGGGSATQALTISDFRKVWLVGNLRDDDADQARVGQLAEVRLNSGEILHARIDYVAPAIDPTTRRLLVRGEVPNPDGHLKPETYATFRLLTGSERRALSVPESAVIYEGDTARVWVATPKNHRLRLRQVVAGTAHDGRVGISGGLREGELVVTAGSIFIDRGAKAD